MPRYFDNVRTGTYALQAWSSGGHLAEVSTTYLQNDVVVHKGRVTSLENLNWKTQGQKQIFQVGGFDRTALGFRYGSAPYQHALVDRCPANLTYTVSQSKTSDWCFAQSIVGSQSIKFYVHVLLAHSSAVLTVLIASTSSGVDTVIQLNQQQVGNLTSGDIPSGPGLYRSAMTAGEWHLFEFPVEADVIKRGWNELKFVVIRTTPWHGIMWDSIILEWA